VATNRRSTGSGLGLNLGINLTGKSRSAAALDDVEPQRSSILGRIGWMAGITIAIVWAIVAAIPNLQLPEEQPIPAQPVVQEAPEATDDSILDVGVGEASAPNTKVAALDHDGRNRRGKSTKRGDSSSVAAAAVTNESGSRTSRRDRSGSKSDGGGSNDGSNETTTRTSTTENEPGKSEKSNRPEDSGKTDQAEDHGKSEDSKGHNKPPKDG
jgi:hypothetical protein